MNTQPINEEKQRAYLKLLREMAMCTSGEEVTKLLDLHSDLLDTGLLTTVDRLVAFHSEQGNEEFATLVRSLGDRLKIFLPEYNQNFQGNLTFINDLLNCPLHCAKEVLIANMYWIVNDSGLMEMMEVCEENLSKQRKEDAAEKLRTIAQWIAKAKSEANNPVTDITQKTEPEIYSDFLSNLIQIALENDGDRKSIYPFLQKNTELLKEEFASYLRSKVTAILMESSIKDSLKLAFALTLVCQAIYTFPQGSKANNIEIVIAGYEIALPIFNKYKNQQLWVLSQNNLAAAYMERMRGDRAFNLERAIQSYQKILQVQNCSNLPAELVRAYMNLGNVYVERIEGEQAKNVEQAIDYYKIALTLCSPNEYPQEWGDIQANLGVAYSRRIYGSISENLELSTKFYQEALSFFACEQFPEKWALISNNLALAYQNQSELGTTDKTELSINIFQSILKVRNCENFPFEWAMAQLNLAGSYCQRVQGDRRHNLELSITCYQAALKIYTKQESPQLWARIQSDLGSVYRERIQGDRSENLELAIQYYKAALEIQDLSYLPLERAHTYKGLGTAYLKRIRGDRADNLEKSIEHYYAALQAYTYEALPQRWADTQNYLGCSYLERIRGDRVENIEQAITCFQNALQVHFREETPQLWADTQMGLGNAYASRSRQSEKINNLKQAIHCYQAALSIYTREVNPLYWAKLQRNLGIAYQNLGQGGPEENIEKAIQYCQAALEVYTQESDPYEWAEIQVVLGTAYAARNNTTLAIDCYKQALCIHTREALPEHWATAMNNLAVAYIKLEEIEEAIIHLKLALEIYTSTAFPHDCLRVGGGLGYHAFKTGQWAKAIEGYSQALEAIETSRSWISSEQKRQKTLESSIDIYQNLVQACLNSKQLDKAIEYVERVRAQRLVDLMVSDELASSESISPAIQAYLQQYEALQRQIDSYRYPQLPEFELELTTMRPTEPSRATLIATNGLIKELETQKQKVWEQLRRLDPVLAGGIKVAAPNLANIQKSIDYKTTAILSFYSTQNNTYIFVVKCNQVTYHTCLEPQQHLQEWLFFHWLLPYIENPNEWRKSFQVTLSELAKWLDLEKLIESHLKNIEELIIIPHLSLHFIPFSALPLDDGQFLGDRFLIRYAPSCQVLEFCQKRPHSKTQLTYGTVEDATEDLPCISFECSQLAQMYSIPEKRRLRGRRQATVSNYRRLVEQVSGLHSSHHAQSRLDNPLESRLVLGDGTITLGQLLTPAWRLPNLEEVFLSCCETGVGLIQSTGDVMTLSTGFLCAGARSVVSTLWSVDDLATALFSIFYYQYRQQGRSRIVSLQQAQHRLRSLSGQELSIYQQSLIPLLESKFRAAEKASQTAKERRDREVRGSEAYTKWHDRYKQSKQVADRVLKTKKRFKSAIAQPLPFSHPFYWAAFTVSGLP